MATRADVRRIAMALPDTVEGEDRFAFSVLDKGKAKGFVWVWMERVEEKKPRVPNKGVVAIRVPNQAEKEMLLATVSDKFFTEPHYNGFPAVLVRLKAIGTSELRELIVEAWRTLAPRALVKDYDASHEA